MKKNLVRFRKKSAKIGRTSFVRAGIAFAITATVGVATAQEAPGSPAMPLLGPQVLEITPNVNDQFSDDPGDPNAIVVGVSAEHPALYPNNLVDDLSEDESGPEYSGPIESAGLGDDDPDNSVGALEQPLAPVLRTGEVLGDIDEIRNALGDSGDFMVGLFDENSAANSNGTVRVIVTLRPPVGTAETNVAAVIERAPEVESALSGTNSVVETVGDHIAYMVVSIDSAGLDALLTTDAVGAVELDKSWPVNLDSSGPVTRIDDMYAEGLRGDGDGGNAPWEVVIVDTGVRKTHEKISPNVVAEACYTTDASCPNGSNSMVGSGAAVPCSGGANRCDHGTHVASIAAGDISAGLWGSSTPPGYASEANIVAINVFQGASTSPGAFTSSIVNALNFALAREAAGGRVASVNLSLGGGIYSGTCDTTSASTTTAVNNLRSAGILPVAAAGNGSSTSTMGWPACITNMISVGNTTDSDAVSSSSSVSSVTDVWAPGTSIYAGSAGSDTQYEYKTGTSMAAPAVAGAAAALYDCPDWNNASGGNGPASGFDDTVIGSLKVDGVNVTDGRTGGSVTLPRIDVYKTADTWNTNNRFLNPETLLGASGANIDYTNCGTIEAGEPYPLNFTHKSASNWFKWTAPDDGVVEFTTCDALTNHNTSLAIWKGTTLASLEFFGYDNGDSTCTEAIGFGADRIAVPVVDGEELRVAVYGHSKNVQGRFNLRHDFTPDYPTVPDAPTLLKPVSITTDLSPTFIWSDVGGATTHYRLWINDSTAGSPDIMNWYADNAICTGGVCTVSPGAVAAGDVTWNVQSYSTTNGFGSWAGNESFTASSAAPAAAVKWTPTGTVTDSTPVYMWKASSSAESYRIYMQVNDAYFTDSITGQLTGAEVNCPYGTGYCSYQPTAVHPTGPARYWIVTYNGNGSTGTGWQTYTRASGTSGAALPYTPPVSSMAAGNPVTFKWSAHPGATNYRLFVRDAANITRADVTLSAGALGCAAGTGTCTRTVSGIPAGNARWFVRNKFGAVWGGWSRATWITVPTP